MQWFSYKMILMKSSNSKFLVLEVNHVLPEAISSGLIISSSSIFRSPFNLLLWYFQNFRRFSFRIQIDKIGQKQAIARFSHNCSKNYFWAISCFSWHSEFSARYMTCITFESFKLKPNPAKVLIPVVLSKLSNSPNSVSNFCEKINGKFFVLRPSNLELHWKIVFTRTIG